MWYSPLACPQHQESFYTGVQGFDSVLSKEKYQGDCVSRRYSCPGKIIQGSLQNRDQVLKLLRQLGFQLNQKKSSLIPSQVFTYLGLLCNTKTMQVFLPLGKIYDLRQAAQLILSKTQITCRQAMRFLGKVNHAVQAVPEAHLHFRIFQRQLISIYRNQFDLFKLYTVSGMAREDLIWWANLKESSCTMSLLEPQA